MGPIGRHHGTTTHRRLRPSRQHILAPRRAPLDRALRCTEDTLPQVVETPERWPTDKLPPTLGSAAPPLRDITFDLHGSGWSSSAFGDLGHVLCEFSDVFSTSETPIWARVPFYRSIFPFPRTDPLPPPSPYRINPVLAKGGDIVLD